MLQDLERQRVRSQHLQTLRVYIKQEARRVVQVAASQILREGRVAEQQAKLAAMAAESDKARQQEQECAADPSTSLLPYLLPLKKLQCYCLRSPTFLSIGTAVTFHIQKAIQAAIVNKEGLSTGCLCREKARLRKELGLTGKDESDIVIAHCTLKRQGSSLTCQKASQGFAISGVFLALELLPKVPSHGGAGSQKLAQAVMQRQCKKDAYYALGLTPHDVYISRV